MILASRMCSKYLSEKRDRSYKQLQHHFNDCSIVWSVVSISCGVLLILLMLLFYMYRDANTQKSKKGWTRRLAWGTPLTHDSAPKSHMHTLHTSTEYNCTPTHPLLLARSNQEHMLCFAVVGFSRDASSTVRLSYFLFSPLRLSSVWCCTNKRKHENGVKNNWQSYANRTYQALIKYRYILI